MKKFFQGKMKILIMIAFLFLFFFNTVAYSGLASKLAITSEAMFRPITDIRVTGIKLVSASNGAIENYSPKYNVDTTTTGFTLPSANSEITYKITVTNYGNVKQTIYKFIKNSVSAEGLNVKVTDFTSVCTDENCSSKNSDYTIVHPEGDSSSESNVKEFLITFTTTNPSSTTINIIEKYDFRPLYYISYDANGGKNAPESQIKIYGDNLNLTNNEPTRDTYDFKGWSTSSTSTTVEYKSGDIYSPGTDEKVQDVTLYAVWEKKTGKLDLNYIVDGTWYYSGYNNKIQTGIKVAGSDKGYLNDFGGTYEYGTSYEIYGFKIDGVEIPYSKKYTVDGNNYLNISFNTINFTVNNANLGSITPTQLIVIPGTTFTVSSNVITLSDGRIATASTKDVTGYKTKFSSYTITPNSTTINAKTTAQANFTKEAEKYTITLDNKSATTAGTTAIYEKYNTGIYLDGALTKAMTTSTNAITKPSKTGYTFKGYYTKENGQGDQIINENGYITENITSTTYTANATLYAYYEDDIKPTLTLTNSSNGNWTNKDVTVKMNGTDAGSGIKEYQWKENGTWTTRAISITNGVGSITYTVDRNLEIEFRAIDNAGNISDIKTTYVRRDTVAPKIELNGSANSTEINNNSVTIPIKITETASGMNSTEFTASDISILVNGTAVNPSTKTLTYSSVSNGVYSYTLTLGGITLNGKVTIEIAAGTVKDIATNSNVKTTLDPSITVNNTYTISLNGNGATTAGTTAIYEKYNTGIYLDSALSNAMSTNANAITKPTRSYTVSFNANNTGITIPSAITKSYSYSGHYTAATNGTQMINENGYITSSFKNTSYTANGTLYAHWGTKPSVTIPTISNTGYTCTWNTSADGNGTTYNGGDVTDKLNTQTLYAICKANTYKMTFNSNKKYVEAPSAGGFQITKMSDSDGDFYRASFSNSFSTSNSWYWIAYKNYAFTAGSNYRIRAKFRIIENENVDSLGLRHAAVSNDYWTSDLKVVNVISSSLNTWKEYSLDRVINSSYTNSSGTSYDASPRLEIYTQNLAATSGTINRKLVLDIKDVYINKITDQEKTYGTILGTLPTDSREGYTFSGWYTDSIGGTQISSTTSVPSKDTTYYAHWTANTNTKYVVKHYKQKLDGTYPSEADDTDNLTGTTDSSVAPTVKDVKNNSNYIGFTAPSVQTVTIAADGSTLVTYKYTRNKYTFTLGSAAGVSTSGSTASGSYYYGSTITLKATASSGYTWSKWTSSNTSLVGNQTNASTTITMPAGNITMTPNVMANALTFNDQSKTVTYNPTTNQNISITGASNGSGSYSYSIISGNDNSYFSISGTTITVKSNTPANTSGYKITVRAIDTNSKVTKDATITIIVDKKSVTKPTSSADKVYNAEEQNHGITVSEGTSIVTNGSTLKATNVGTYNVIFTLNSNYKWSDGTTSNVTIQWKITAYNLSNATIGSISDQTYTGSEIKPTTSVTVPIPSGSKSTPTYTTTYSNNMNAGTATITLTGTGNYTGTKSTTFKIVTAENPVKVTANDLTYNTQAQSLVTTKDAQGTICYSLDSVITSKCSTSTAVPTAINAGTYTVYYYINGNSNYKEKSGSVIVTIKKYDLSTNGIIGTINDQTYTGSEIKPTPLVTASMSNAGVATLVNNTDYTYSYSNNINAGTTSNPYATVNVTGKGNYTGTKSKTFKIIKATNPTVITANDLTYNAAEQTLVTSSKDQGYICYSLSAVPTSCSASSALAKGTNAGTYTVYYLISGNSNYNSKSGSVKVSIKQYDISKTATIGIINDQVYTGNAIKPTPSVTVPIPTGKTTTFVNNTDFTYSYSNNTNIGTANITITGQGNYTGTKSTTFKISQKASSCTITSVPTLKYPSSATGSIQFKCTGDGKITVTSSNTGVIEVTNTGTTGAGLKGATAGTSKITVSQAAGNYEASSASADVTVTYSQYTVTLDGNGATTQGSTTAVATYNSTTLSKITNPIREYTITYDMGTTGLTKPDNGKVEYRLNGWYTASSNGTKVANNSTTPALEASVNGYTNASKQWTKTSDATLYAGWTQGSTTLATLIKEGNTCTWIDNNGNSYNSGQTGYTTGSNITLTPRCLPNSYVLTINPNEGTWNNTTSASPVPGKFGTEYEVANPTRTGYTFTGWTKSGAGSWNSETKKYTFGAGAGTLTANWTANALTFSNQSKTVTYNPTGSQTVNISPATNGTGSYSYSIISGNDNSYFSISGTTITVKAGTPANTSGYKITVRATDTNSKVTKDATITIIINKKTDTISFTDTTVTYDGKTHGVSNLTSTSGVVPTVTYYSNSSCSTTTTTVNAETAGGAPKNAGVYYAKATTIESSNYSAGTKSCTKAVTINKASASISYATTTITKTYGDSKFTNTLTKTGDGTVKYTSGDTKVATVDSTTGEVTIVSAGTVTITATVTDGTNYAYATKTATYTLKVNAKVITITFSLNKASGMTLSGSTSVVTTDQKVTCSISSGSSCTITSPKITAPSATPTVVGWNTSSTATTSTWNEDTAKSVSSNATYYAITKKNVTTYTTSSINTNNGGTLSSTSNLSCTIAATYNGIAQATSCEVTMPTITTKSNVTPNFVGWSTSASATTNDSSYNKTTNKLTLTGNNTGKAWYLITTNGQVTYTAKVNSNKATLSSTGDLSCTIAATYNGTAQATSCKVTMPTITAPSATPTIVGWNTSANATTDISGYSSSGTNLTLTSSNTGKTWYAITRKDLVTYTASISTNGGGTLSSGANVRCTIAETYNGTAQATSCEVTMPTITTASSVTPNFVGWNTDKTATTNNSSYNKTTNKLTLTSSNANKTWYLITTNNSITYTAKVNGNNSTLSSTGDLSCTIAATFNGTSQATSCRITMPTVTAPSATPIFVGWNTDKNATTNGSDYASSGNYLTLTNSNTGGTYYAITRNDSSTYTALISANGGGTLSSTTRVYCVLPITYNGNVQPTSCEIAMPTITTASSVTPIFVGWNTNKNATTNNSNYNKTTNKLTLTSGNSSQTWYLITTNSPVTYTGKVNGNGSTLSSTNDISCTVGSTFNGNAQATSCTVTMPAVTAPSATPTKVGWNTNANATTNDSSYTLSTNILGLSKFNTGKTWYAITKKNATTYSTSSINANGGGTLSSTNNLSCTIPETYNGTAQATSCTVTMPTITTKSSVTPTFVGWNTSSGSTTNDSSYNGTTNNLTLTNSNTGKPWYLITTNSPVTYTGTVNGNDATLVDSTGATLSSPIDISCTVGSTYNGTAQATSCTVTMPSVKKTGYTIIGWNTNATATSSDSSYTLSTNILGLSKSNTGKTWYPVFSANQYTITFDGNGGTASSATKKVTYNETYGTLPTATRTADQNTNANYSFEGWYTTTDSSGKNVSTETIVNDETLNLKSTDHYLYAHWLKAPRIVASTTEWTSEAVDVSILEDGASDSGDISYQYYLSDTNTLPSSPNWQPVSEDNVTTVDIDDEQSKEIYVFYRVVNASGVTAISNYVVVKIDKITPSTSLTSYKKGTTNVVESDTWVNSTLEFKFGDVQSGLGGANIYYCIQDDTASDSEGDSNDCDPDNIVSANTAIPVAQTNTKTGQYTVRYKTISTSTMESEVEEYKAKIDMNAPNITALVSTNNKLVSTLKTGDKTTDEITTWTTDDYDFDVSQTEDGDNESGIAKIAIQYNDINLTEVDKTKLNEEIDISEKLSSTLTGNGARYAVITAYDNAGNSSKVDFTAYIDDVVPVVSITAVNQAGTAIASEKLSPTGLTFTVTATQSGPSGYTIYTCRDDANECEPENKQTTNKTHVSKAFANYTTFDKFIRAKAISGAGVESDIDSYHARVGTTDVDIVVQRTDNSKAVSSSTWVNSTVKFKLTSTNTTLNYCVDTTNKCSPTGTAGKTVKKNTFVELTNTGKFYIRYSANSGTVKTFAAYVDKTAPTIKITAYKLNDSNNTAANTTVLKTVTNATFSITEFKNYGYYFSLSGSGDESGGSGIASMVWAYNDAGNATMVRTTTKSSQYNKVKNVYISASGARYATVTLTDKAGNTRKVAIGVRIDKTAPKMVLKMYKATSSSGKGAGIQTVTANTNTGAWKNYGYYFDLSGSSDNLQISTMTVEYNAGGNASMVTTDLTSKDIKSAKHVVISGDGARFARFTITDLAGNKVTRYVKFYIDKAAPSITWGTNTQSGSKITFKYTCKDNYSQLKNSSGAKVATLDKTVSLSQSGVATAVCTDRAGNTSKKQTAKWYYNANSVCGTHEETESYTESYTYTTKYLTMPVNECTARDDYAYYKELNTYNLCDCYVYRTGYETKYRTVTKNNTCWHK